MSKKYYLLLQKSQKLPISFFAHFWFKLVHCVQRPSFLRFCFTLISFLLKPSIPRSKVQILFFKAKVTLFRNKRFMLEEMFQWNASKFALLLEYEKLQHSSQFQGLCLTKSSCKMLQNLPYFMYKKTNVVFFLFHFVKLYNFT